MNYVAYPAVVRDHLGALKEDKALALTELAYRDSAGFWGYCCSEMHDGEAYILAHCLDYRTMTCQSHHIHETSPLTLPNSPDLPLTIVSNTSLDRT